MYKNILQTIGNTPLVQLNKINSSIYAKIESFNPAGSIKDRISLMMIETAENEGYLKKKDVIIEPTSGNTGIGLAMVSAVKGYKIILTMPEDMSVERRKILTSYGAEIILTPKEKGMAGAIKEAERISKEKGYYMPLQFKNSANPLAHQLTTGKEIANELIPNFFVAGIGTGGTIMGVGKVLKPLGTKIIAVEPYESAVLSGNNPAPHKIQGIGAGFIPEILDTKIYDDIIKVKINEAYTATKLLALNEGILAGISSGANLHAALLIAENNPGKSIVTVFPDTGERYLSSEILGDDKNV
jgi:cysteine synthase